MEQRFFSHTGRHLGMVGTMWYLLASPSCLQNKVLLEKMPPSMCEARDPLPSSIPFFPHSLPPPRILAVGRERVYSEADGRPTLCSFIRDNSTITDNLTQGHMIVTIPHCRYLCYPLCSTGLVGWDGLVHLNMSICQYVPNLKCLYLHHFKRSTGVPKCQKGVK